MFDGNRLSVVGWWWDLVQFLCIIIFDRLVEGLGRSGAAQSNLLVNKFHEFVLILEYVPTQMLKSKERHWFVISSKIIHSIVCVFDGPDSDQDRDPDPKNRWLFSFDCLLPIARMNVKSNQRNRTDLTWIFLRISNPIYLQALAKFMLLFTKICRFVLLPFGVQHNNNEGYCHSFSQSPCSIIQFNNNKIAWRVHFVSCLCELTDQHIKYDASAMYRWRFISHSDWSK